MEKELKQKSLRKNARLITTTQAAELAGVTKVTIQNLCRGGYLSYTLKGKMYMVSKSDVKKYIKSIQEINNATNDIEAYKLQLKEEAAQLKSKVESNRSILKDLKIYPKRAKAMSDFCCAMLENYSRGKIGLGTRDFYVVRDILQGKSAEEIAYCYHLDSKRVNQIWSKALRTIDIEKNEIDNLTEQVKQLKTEINNRDREIIRLKNIPLDITDEYVKTRSLLMSKVDRYSFSKRTLNCLRDFTKIVTVGDLVRTNPKELLKYRNFGKKSLEELQNFLSVHELYFCKDISKYYSSETN